LTVTDSLKVWAISLTILTIGLLLFVGYHD